MVTGDGGSAEEDRACAEYIAAIVEEPKTEAAAFLARAERSAAAKKLRADAAAGLPGVSAGDVEACLEVMQTDALVGIQDMGAAGLTCSTTEMGSRGGAGVEIDVADVPQREAGMTPYEIMLSESQERMLIVAKRGREQDVVRIFEKWDLNGAVIGEVTSDGFVCVLWHGEEVARIPVGPISTEAPVYERPVQYGGASPFTRAAPAGTRRRVAP